MELGVVLAVVAVYFVYVWICYRSIIKALARTRAEDRCELATMRKRLAGLESERQEFLSCVVQLELFVYQAGKRDKNLRLNVGEDMREKLNAKMRELQAAFNRASERDWKDREGSET